MTVTMDRQALWSAVDHQRAAVADLLASLEPAEWSAPSLCTRWTVREVAAHLTLQELRPRDMLARLPIMLRARGDLDRAIHDMAVARVAEAGDAELVARIRATVGSRRHNPGVTRLETLTDILVHAQDIAIPLGRELAMPPGPAAVAATRMWTMRWPRPFPIKRTLRHFRLTATDADWSNAAWSVHPAPASASPSASASAPTPASAAAAASVGTAGEVPSVEGPMGALLMLTCGRTAVLPLLSGPGLAQLTAALTPAAGPTRG
ncbi:maleylpyruvate isomerase family mycothiol-dependent enzyme [Dactylosporangium sp. CA-092794]|uniref:maleylpyruvate isomerase family mycothiol-dependent enzyme n=1 Tax=Dactylosporangium sp. CA-092794 TaxID=3239929 RepID=UPI003D89F4FD